MAELTYWTTDDGSVVPEGDPEAMYPVQVDEQDAEKVGLVERKKASKPADKQRTTAKNKGKAKGK